MRKLKLSIVAAAVAVAIIGASGVQAHDDHGRSFAHLQGVWMSKVTIRDCATGTPIAGPFSGLITFQAGGTLHEMGPALPNSTRSPGHGTWKRLSHTEFEQRLIFLRYDLSGIFLGTQVITAKPVVAKDSMSYSAQGGRFEVKDTLGATIATGCSSATGTRFQ